MPLFTGVRGRCFLRSSAHERRVDPLKALTPRKHTSKSRGQKLSQRLLRTQGATREDEYRVYEPITVEIDRSYGDGIYRSHSVNFTGRLVQLIEEDFTTMRLYEWVDRGYVVYLVHVEEAKPEQRPPRRTLYPFINTHTAGATPRKGYTAEKVSRAYPEFAKGTFLFLGRPRSSPTR